ncbi:UDP-N-acetylmuramoyl-L-alanyl-D-glutamate--2,6-diaminopimelate ligase [Planomicrobium sp. CPCC 101079]|uniref:UDP-N-acetylmuramoyl-L-alanyl-D-glutamate--2, 6-diaminopimelate ligase n=1 Tax=Planomicrobium sp. CPCC 101079 TaxID=2599618 RepID=UPI0011B43799|nr:UDP-N-acetylmuramoyl-L-alanyl-D-glutamate--2,6-diaminopimelate ligase [Planomicrobium sp. CPCC 101079]TWT02312.1 UDP-N-acetylmuramoyl-L-alanyl-D-glutamate--2,6-diaminopimelate ligase [Planomicrobium sp. CPCC 101079]
MNIQFNRIPEFSLIACYGPETQEISSIVYNSQEVADGSAFFCVSGENTDGHLYIEEAIQRGATAIIGTDRQILETYAKAHHMLTFAVVEDSRTALAYASAQFYNKVQDQFIKIGVTGTNGKTTTATYVYHLFNLLGIPCGFLGTTGIWNSAGKIEYKKSTPTTPMSSDIHNIFSQLDAFGDQAASMEVSSIALDQKRVEGILFDVAIHTNISEEHMEYHKVFEHYLQCKLQLFSQAKNAVINFDDKGMAQEILDVVNYPLLTYSRYPESGADLVWANCKSQKDGLVFDLLYKGQSYPIHVPLYGEYNAANLTAAIGAALLAGASIDKIVQVLPKMPQVEGRFQVIKGPEDRKIILDYAHTPVALDLVLKEVRKLPHNRLIALIAGVGIRDFGKMPKMGRIAEGKADVLVVTVDHPGFHNPEDIINEVLKGLSVPYKQKVRTAPSRREGVIEALKESGPNDIILLSSGNINGAQIVKGESIPHSDEEVIEGFFMQQN